MTDLTADLIQKIIDKSLEPINKRLDDLEEEINVIGDVIGRDGDVKLTDEE